jgi:hypothetical protein
VKPSAIQILTVQDRDPNVARRVRRLQVRPEFPKEHNDSESSLHRQLNMIRRTLRLPTKPSQASLPPSKIIESAIEIIPGLVNATEFAIDSWFLPSGYDIQPLFTIAWSNFGRNLRKISLGGNVESFQAFTTSHPQSHLHSLQELSLEFADNRFRVDNVTDGAILLENVVPFVNGLGAQLRCLTVSSWTTVDLSSFFMSLGPFAALRRFKIRTAFDKAFKKDPSGLTRFLHDNSSTLQHVELRLNPTFAFESFSEQSLSRWLSGCVADTLILANLRILQIYPTLLLAGFDALVEFLRRSSDTLTTLVVRDRYLLSEEVDVVVGVFSAENGLKSLRLNVRTLTAELVDLLAEKLPGLEELTLYIGDSATGDNASVIVGAASF